VISDLSKAATSTRILASTQLQEILEAVITVRFFSSVPDLVQTSRTITENYPH